MGNCTCPISQAEGSASTEVNVSLASREKAQFSVDILNPPKTIHLVEPLAMEEISNVKTSDAPPTLIPQQVVYTKADVVALQSYFRCYLSVKSCRAKSSGALVWSDWAFGTPIQSQKAKNDGASNLSTLAQEALNKKGKFQFDKDVSGVVSREAQVLSDGSIYCGQWAVHDNEPICPQGKGRCYGIDGSFSEGYWKAGQLHSKGRLISADGDFYEGDFLNGKKEGKGVYETASGHMQYQGDWRADRRHGHGVEIYSDGARFEGDFLDGEKTGRGQIVYEDGSVYKGEFVNGEFEGFGEYSWSDGRYYTGHWKKSMMNGKGKFSYKDGKWYDGEYVNDKKEGSGIYSWDNKLYEGDWKQGKMHGIGYYTNEKGRRKYEYVEGNRIREIVD